MPSITYGARKIEFDIQFSDRKNLEINVLPDKSVIVKAPNDKLIDDILARVKKRSGWIVKQQHFFDNANDTSPEKEYVSGESIYYLGKQYRLKVIALDDLRTNEPIPTRETVKLIGQYLRVYSGHKDNPEHVRKQVKKWFRTHAAAKFRERFEICSKIARRYQITNVDFELREMKNRWGSHTSTNKILLNPGLIEYPSYCIDYVIIHELCHTKHLNHSRDFYNLLTRMLPDWQRYKARLENK